MDVGPVDHYSGSEYGEPMGAGCVFGLIVILVLAVIGCMVLAFCIVYSVQYFEARSSGNPLIHVPLLD